MNSAKIPSPCPVFGLCGGCQYQDLPYEEELRIKHKGLRDLFSTKFNLKEDVLAPVIPSPQSLHYRSRLDMRFLRTKEGETFMGFSPARSYRLVEVSQCPIAMEAVSDFLPRLKRQAAARLPASYRNANLVVKTGDDGRVFWGGIGRRSLCLPPENYLWTEVRGKRIFFSLETFFQANLKILDRLFAELENLFPFDDETVLWDLYAGVGLFGVVWAGRLDKVILIEDDKHAIKLARYNTAFHKLNNCEIMPGTVENHEALLRHLQKTSGARKNVAIIDPPRNGLSPQASEILSALKGLECLFYLSCQPEALLRDMEIFLARGWGLKKIIPFDFFPRTRHMETLAVLCPERE